MICRRVQYEIQGKITRKRYRYMCEDLKAVWVFKAPTTQ